jgi:hypothetical protein
MIHMPRIRSDGLRIIKDLADGVFAAVLDKTTIKNKWKQDELGNFIFAQSLFVNVMNTLSPPNPPVVYYDRGGFSLAMSISFKSYIVNKDEWFEYKGLKLYRGNIPPPLDVSSIQEPCIWAADLVAGAFYHKHMNKEWSYANILQPKMICSEERIFWKTRANP